MFTRAGQPGHCVVALYVGEGSEREQCHLFSSWLAFSHFLCYPQARWGLSGADSWVVGFVYVLDAVGLYNEPSCEAGSFFRRLNRHRFFQSFCGFIPPRWSPGLHSLSRSLLAPPSLFTHKCGTDHPTSCLLAHPSCPSLPLLPVWMNVSSLTPWLSDFHSLIFLQFWLFFALKFVVVLLLVVPGSKVYLPMPPSWPEVLIFKCTI